MDASVLAKMMLDWEKLRRRCDEMEAAIRDCVLQTGKTLTVGNVRAMYRRGSNGFDSVKVIYKGAQNGWKDD